MSNLIVNHHLLARHPPAGVSALAHSLTGTAVAQLDGARRGSVLAFLANAGLLSTGTGPGTRGDHPPAVPIDGLDFEGAQMGSLRLGTASLAGANLQKTIIGVFTINSEEITRGRADLTNVDLRGARIADLYWTGVNLYGARLDKAVIGLGLMRDVRFTNACVNGTRFGRSDLDGVDISDAIGRGTDFSEISGLSGGPNFKPSSGRQSTLADIKLPDWFRTTDLPPGWTRHGDRALTRAGVGFPPCPS